MDEAFIAYALGMKTLFFALMSALAVSCQGELKDSKISSSCSHNGVPYDCATGRASLPDAEASIEEVTERRAFTFDITMTANSQIEIDAVDQFFLILEDDKVTANSQSIFSEEINSCAVSLRKDDIYHYELEGQSLILELEGVRIVFQPLYEPSEGLVGRWVSHETTDEGVEITRQLHITHGGRLSVSKRCLHR